MPWRGERLEGADLPAATRRRHRRAKPVGALGVVGVAMGQHDALDLAAGGLPHRPEVRRVRGAGIHNPGSHDVAVGAVKRQQRRVARPHAHHAGGVSVSGLHTAFLAGCKVALLARASTVQRSFLLGLAIATAITVVDAVEGAQLVLIGLLIAGPLVAALGATTRQTTIVAAYALVLGLVLGIPDEIFLDTEHFTRLLAILFGSGLSIYVARLRGQRELDSSRLRTQFAAARVFADAETLKQAAPRFLDAIGRHQGWDVAGYWETREPDTLRYVSGWH